jgi:hypothetical protein
MAVGGLSFSSVFSIFSLRNQFAYDFWPQYIHLISPLRILSGAAQGRKVDDQAGTWGQKMFRDTAERERLSAANMAEVMFLGYTKRHDHEVTSVSLRSSPRKTTKGMTSRR